MAVSYEISSWPPYWILDLIEKRFIVQILFIMQADFCDLHIKELYYENEKEYYIISFYVVLDIFLFVALDSAIFQCNEK